MVKVYEGGAWLLDGGMLIPDGPDTAAQLQNKLGTIPGKEEAAKGAMAYSILEGHNTSDGMDKLKIKFDAMASHDITSVGSVQTARSSGLTEFPIPYVLTNCHNSLCAVGGTINEDDHVFGLSAAKKYGGIFVPPHLAVIHQYMREMHAGCGKMILGSDSHTRYGALGTMAVGEGGPELVKQLLGRTYDIDMPEIVAVHLTGKPRPGVGPMDVALALIGAVFKSGAVKNKVLEFVGDGVGNLSADYRIGIDVMTTETTCLSTIWRTDDTIRDYLAMHGRREDYAELNPAPVTYYDGLITIDLDKVRPMIAMPFHPSNTYAIEELNGNLGDILRQVEKEALAQLDNDKLSLHLMDKIRDGGLYVDQAVIAGCAGGTFENICAAADILKGQSVGSDELMLSVYPSSQPVNLELVRNGTISTLLEVGATWRTAFCGPCFGAGDVPANEALSIRHTTRNFPNREGSKPGEGQITSVALMDARSIAATVRNNGRLTPATDLDIDYSNPSYRFDSEVYQNRIYFGYGKADPKEELVFGPNIADWPVMQPLADNLLLEVASVITDPVTTTDELIPSGETSSYRSNPLRLAEFALSRKDPAYVGRAKAVQALEKARLSGGNPLDSASLKAAYDAAAGDVSMDKIGIGSVIYAVKPGDGSAREQAASCQKVLGTFANVAEEYATKRYRSNLINWGMLPLQFPGGEAPFQVGDYLWLPGIRGAVERNDTSFRAFVVHEGTAREITLTMSEITPDERDIILAGCLMNYYKNQMENGK
ncbi:MAG: hydratase [Oscillospiraceae bacterium]